jgi:UDP-N-acetylmuramoylalanine--D-glutamate ligase
MSNGLAGKRVTVMGLGTRGGGLGVARWLVEQGAAVTITDLRSADALAAPIEALNGLDVRLALGGHDERDFTPAGADMVIRNPGVRLNSKYLQIARDSGVPIEMEMSLFLRACPAPVIGITGTKGKTTTALLTGAMLRAWNPKTVVAGNMGVTALGQLASITPETPVVLELSSWQVEALREHGLAPHIAVLTNISDDHLDAYDGFEDYAKTKRSLVQHLDADGFAVLNQDDPETRKAGMETIACIVRFGTGPGTGNGCWIDGAKFHWRYRGDEATFEMPRNPALAGAHQPWNVAAAIAAATLYGAPSEAVKAGLRAFTGAPHRLERVATIGGVLYVNDSAATAPAAAISALKSFGERRIHLIAGGSDKKTDLAEFAAAAGGMAHRIYLLEGAGTDKLKPLLEPWSDSVAGVFGSMAEAVDAAAGAAEHGDVVLLAPACASFGMFRDEFDRGDQFQAQVLMRKSSRPR